VAQNVTEWSSETRTVLAFRVSPAALQRLLPDGWTSAPSTSPASPGANLNVTLMERTIVLDPQGKPIGSGTARYAVFAVPTLNAKTGQPNTIVVGGLSPEGAGAYGVYLTATTSRFERTIGAEVDGQARVRESWELVAPSGERLSLQIAYRRGPAARGRVETVVHSAIHSDFQRTYRIEQATDLVRSANAPDRVESLDFKASGPKLAQLFDGTERLVAVTAIPHYVREISIP